MPVESDGTFTKRDSTTILSELIAALRAQFGNNVDVTPTGTMRKFLEAALMLPLAETEAALDELYRQMFFESATGDNLDKLVEPIGFRRAPAARATGTVNVTLNSAITSPPQPTPWLPAGSVIFVDTAGRKYENSADVLLNGTTSLAIPVRAADLGSSGNIEANAIVDAQPNAIVSSRWSTNVSTFTNSAAFTGGADEETDKQLRQRVRNSNAAKPGTSLDGVIASVEELKSAGVLAVTGIDNEEDVGGQQNKVFDSNGTGTASETIQAGGTYTKIAMKVPAGLARRFIQHFNAKVTHIVAPTMNVLVTDEVSSAPGSIIAPNIIAHPYAPTNNVVTGGTFHDGFYPDAAKAHWVVFEVTVGSCTFDGDATGTVGDVKLWNGSAWVNSALRRLNMELIGGVPPHGFRVFVSGGNVNDIAKQIHKVKAAGIRSDGLTSGTVTDASGKTRTIYFDRPTLTPVTVAVEVTYKDTFGGDANTIKDIIIAYIGGTDTKNVIHQGLVVNKRVVRNEIISRILDDDEATGLHDVVTLTLGRKSGAQGTSNIVPTDGEEFIIEAVGDITVTLTPAEEE